MVFTSVALILVYQYTEKSWQDTFKAHFLLSSPTTTSSAAVVCEEDPYRDSKLTCPPVNIDI